jgi:hypothetical protein
MMAEKSATRSTAISMPRTIPFRFGLRIFPHEAATPTIPLMMASTMTASAMASIASYNAPTGPRPTEAYGALMVPPPDEALVEPPGRKWIALVVPPEVRVSVHQAEIVETPPRIPAVRARIAETKRPELNALGGREGTTGGWKKPLAPDGGAGAMLKDRPLS